MHPGDVVTADYPGITGVKRRPAVVVSTDAYHQTRPDAIIGVLTSKTARATQPSDYLLQDWSATGLRKPSAFRAFFMTLPASALTVIGQLSERDWQAIQDRLKVAIAIS